MGALNVGLVGHLQKSVVASKDKVHILVTERDHSSVVEDQVV